MSQETVVIFHYLACFLINELDQVKRFVFFIISIFWLHVSFSQKSDSSSNSLNSKALIKSYATLKVQYSSDNVFLGRASILKAPYISTSLNYYHKSGLFLKTFTSYLPNGNNSGIDLFSSSLGYHFLANDYYFILGGTKYLFNANSTSVYSSLVGNLFASVNRDFNWMSISAATVLYFSQYTDFNLDITFDHDFYAFNGNLRIAPSIDINIGTQNYFGNYNNIKRFGGGMSQNNMNATGGASGMGGMGGGSYGNNYGSQSGNFNVLDYELSIPINYTIHRVNLEFTPVYAIPLNPATIQNGQTSYSENLSSKFYFSFGILYKIYK